MAAGPHPFIGHRSWVLGAIFSMGVLLSWATDNLDDDDNNNNYGGSGGKAAVEASCAQTSDSKRLCEGRELR